MFWRNWRSRASRWGLLSAILAVAVVATGIGELSSSTVANGTVSTNEVGVYVGALAPQSTNSFGRAVGHQPSFALDFLDGGTWSTLVNEAPTYMSTWSGSGYEMVWGLPMLPNSFSADPNVADTSGSAYGLQQGAAGAYDSYFLKLAQEMVAGGQGNSIIRPGWEFNGNWFAWSADGQAAAFVGYWQQIVNTMRSVAGQNFHFEWNPTMGDTGIGNLADFYPGNAYVDEIGLDVYDQSWGTYTGISSEWNTFLTEPYGLNWLASFAASQGKPITFPEWGLDPNPSSNNGGPTSQPGSEVGGGDDPTFINDMAQWISQHNVLDASYWDYNSSQLSGSSNPNSYTAFKNDFGGAVDADHDHDRTRFDHDDDRSRRDDDHHARHNDDDDRSRVTTTTTAPDDHDDSSCGDDDHDRSRGRQPRRQILRTRRQPTAPAKRRRQRRQIPAIRPQPQIPAIRRRRRRADPSGMWRPEDGRAPSRHLRTTPIITTAAITRRSQPCRSEIRPIESSLRQHCNSLLSSERDRRRGKPCPDQSCGRSRAATARPYRAQQGVPVEPLRTDGPAARSRPASSLLPQLPTRWLSTMRGERMSLPRRRRWCSAWPGPVRRQRSL